MRFRRHVAVLAISVFLVACCFALKELPAADLPRVPEGNALGTAQANVAVVFGSDIKQATTTETRVALARKMIAIAKDEKGDAARYALLQRARDLAVDANDARLGFEITEAIVAGFALPAGDKRSSHDWVVQGDELRQVAKKKRDRRARLETRLSAAECYLRAEPGATGLAKEFVDKKIEELALDGLNRKDADLRVLIGKWEVQVGENYHGTWEFRADGTVLKDGRSPGIWTAGPGGIRVQWEDRAWESFVRPISARGTIGDSVHGAGLVRAVKKGG